MALLLLHRRALHQAAASPPACCSTSISAAAAAAAAPPLAAAPRCSRACRSCPSQASTSCSPRCSSTASRAVWQASCKPSRHGRLVAAHAKRRSRSLPSSPEVEADASDVLEGEDLDALGEPGLADPYAVDEDEDEAGFDEDEESFEEDVSEADEASAEDEGEEEEGEGGLLEEEDDAVEMEELSYSEAARQRDAIKRGARARITRVPEDENAGRGAAAELVLPEGAQLALNRQGYQAFQMGDVEFLVAETADGRLDLNDTFVFDAGTSIYARPEVSGPLPAGPVALQAVPWVERKSGDFLRHKEPTARMKKVYFLGVASAAPTYAVDQRTVFKFEAATRLLSKEAVRVVGKDLADPILRIRPDGITLEDSGSIPTPSQLLLQQGDVAPVESEEAREERLKEMEEKEELDKLDEQPDVPNSDMM